MRKRKSITVLAVLSALAVCVIAAASASAFEKAVTCSPTAASKTFPDAHCLPGGSGTSFGHETFTGTTSIEVTNANTASETTASSTWKLRSHDLGALIEVQCTTVSSTSGSLTNQATFVEGTGFLHFTGCIVTKPGGQGCHISGNKVDTEELIATTNGQAASRLKVESRALGEVFALVTFEACTAPALNNTTVLKGSLVAETSGATVTTNHVKLTEPNTLKYAGNDAGVEGALTFKSSANGIPITLT